MAESKSILITGASGFTGRHACEIFAREGWEVFGLVRKRQDGLACEGQIICDLGCPDQVKSAMAFSQPGYVLHLAGQNSVAASWEKPGEFIHANVLGTVNLLEAVREKKPGAKLLVAGSMLQQAVTESPDHPYSLSKTMQMLVAKAWEQLFKMRIILVKPSNLIGPGPSNGICSILAERIAKMEAGLCEPVLEVDHLEVSRDFLDVRDAVRGYMELMGTGESGEVYELGTGSFVSLREIIDAYQGLSQIEFEVVEKKTEAGSIPQKAGRAYSTLSLMADRGWTPAIHLNQSLSDTLHYQRKRIRRDEHV